MAAAAADVRPRKANRAVRKDFDFIAVDLRGCTLPAAKHSMNSRAGSLDAILAMRLLEQTRQGAGSLMRPQKGDDDLPTITTLLTAQFLANGSDRKIIAQVRAQFCQ